MHKTEKQSKQEGQEEGVVYEVRTLPDRWEEPIGDEVLSTHSSAEAALDAKTDELQLADDGTGRSTQGADDGSGGGRW
ncbi:MAG: hypothetical protein ABR540_12920 [Acidimicrobiales bacterium]